MVVNSTALIENLLKGGKSECTGNSTFGAPGTVPAGGDTILVIITGTRGCGFNMTIITGDGVIVIDIP